MLLLLLVLFLLFHESLPRRTAITLSSMLCFHLFQPFLSAFHCPIEFLSEYQVKGDISSLTLLQSFQNNETDVLWLDFLNCQPLEFDSPSNFLVLTLVENKKF